MIVALSIILFARHATKKMKTYPKAHKILLSGVETLKDFLEGIMGATLARKTFWFFATVFIFILFSNWFG
jgi:F-type H+-transporting ATPase subunit a